MGKPIEKWGRKARSLKYANIMTVRLQNKIFCSLFVSNAIIGKLSNKYFVRE